ncbi:hypothetical protein GEMRC1_008753 [Eukaryota sp. GEM-RC1]
MVTALDWIPSPSHPTSTSSSSTLMGGTLAVGTHYAWCYLFGLQVHPRIVLIQEHLFQAGHKVTCVTVRPEINRILVSTNDSRIRSFVYSSCKKGIKYLGHVSKTSHIGATFSPDARYIICGSENRKVYIWPVESNYVPAVNPRLNIFSRSDHNRSTESFEVNGNVTAAVFGPKTLGQAIPGDFYVESGDDNRFIVVATEDGDVFVFENLPVERPFTTPV